ncbi:NADPH:quinone reductase-like Zn-dependent oxidoreductase [Agromyces hippuratus]|uniref:NADPH:quinone reductase-like Zn-dependent oxidoreductase n=1 Tax=Agromyces hippuratus TaxID=286438 RepID=A0A852WU44_9MICO|nr:NAD(P)-dependent alcohol dehydrogenase [Agromyces hippuratus]NYG19493.1 NADPH:quinone reductase-like Zn-dependent oxidoreductase [Agromyces hippuratus]
MRAIVLDRYGPPEQVMHLAELADPVPGAGEVVVRVAAVSLNSWDVDLATGAMLVRLEGPFRPKRRVIGSDVAGTVVAVGGGVTRHRVGDAVFGELSASGWGGFAERVVAREDAVVARPAGVDDLTAAALPQAASMAWQALGGAEAVAPGGALQGRRVLIVGAGGGVGTFAIQLAKRGGAHVTAVERAMWKLEALAELGGDVVAAGAPDGADSRHAFDLVIDVVGALLPAQAKQLLADGGRAAYIGGSPRRIAQVLFAGGRAVRQAGVDDGVDDDAEGEPGPAHSIALLAAVPNRDLPEIAALAAAGELRALIDGPHPLDQVPQQLARLRSGAVLGKAVIGLG